MGSGGDGIKAMADYVTDATEDEAYIILSSILT